MFKLPFNFLVCIHKPVTSRPANSERYLVCLWKRLGTEPAEQHLASVNSILWSDVERGGDVTQLVPLKVLEEDRTFFEYIYKSNCLYVCSHDNLCPVSHQSDNAVYKGQHIRGS